MLSEQIIIVSNVPRLATARVEGMTPQVRPIDEPQTFGGARRLLSKNRDAHFVLVDGTPGLLLKLCLVRCLLPRAIFGGPRLVALDLVLNKPVGLKERLRAFFKRLLLRKVDHFLHYFKELKAYHRYFGISPARSSYIPFKVNAWEQIRERPTSPEGDYVFTSGRSMRDFDTFMAAMAQTGLPGMLTYHRRELAAENGTPFPPKQQPANVRIEEDDGSLESWIERIDGARVVVVPILPDAIRAVGISQALVALGLGKAVVMTEGATTHGVFGEEIMTAPAADAAGLAAVVRRLWDDPALRAEKGRLARRFAEAVGGEDALFARIVKELVRLRRPSA